MTRKKTKTYLEWLKGLIDRESAETYEELLNRLNKKDFHWSVPNDDNRIEDGLQLRSRYTETYHISLPDWYVTPCSVLEIMIGLAFRMEDILRDSEKGDRVPEWFWEMAANLGLDKFSDSNYLRANQGNHLEFLLARFMDRTYDRNGNGSLFPLKNSRKNSARIEIWYQMMAYLDENYAE